MLNILLYTENESCFPENQKIKVQGPYRRYNYYFVLVTKGSAEYFIDNKPETVKEGQVLFVVPHQIFFTLKASEGFSFYKLTLDEECLLLLRDTFSFLIDPMNSPVIALDNETQKRALKLMVLIRSVLEIKNLPNSLVLSYLNTFLMEIESAYMSGAAQKIFTKPDLHKFFAFKSLVENEFTNNPSTMAIAKKIGIPADNLNRTVKKFSGVTPKEFILRRIVLEAKRNLFYDNIPVKELAYSLGFSDPNYFSRLFSEKEGLSISEYLKKMRNLSSKV